MRPSPVSLAEVAADEDLPARLPGAAGHPAPRGRPRPLDARRPRRLRPGAPPGRDHAGRGAPRAGGPAGPDDLRERGSGRGARLRAPRRVLRQLPLGQGPRRDQRRPRGTTLADLVPAARTSSTLRVGSARGHPSDRPPAAHPPPDHQGANPTRERPAPRDPQPPRRARRRPRAPHPPGDRPRRRQGRGPRDHGPQRLRQDHPRLRAHGPPRLPRHAGRGDLEGHEHPGAVARQAGAPGDVPRLPVPDRDPGPVRGVLPADRPQRAPPGPGEEPGHRPQRPHPRRHLDGRLPRA